MDQLTQLKKFSTVVADTGDFSSIHHYSPTDSTTNPSLILLAAKQPLYLPLIEEAIQYAKKQSLVTEGQIACALDKILVNFGKEILKIIPGRVSIEVDARLSFNITESIEKAHHIISLFEREGIPRSRILIKLAATWEGIQAAYILEKENIHCNLTLIFSLLQAAACADANVTLVSPFVGRILDWYKKKHNKEAYASSEDPGVISVSNIYNYYKKLGYATQIMGASFRNKDEILELAGCDFLTISPKLLEELKQTKDVISCKLTPAIAQHTETEKLSFDKDSFHSSLKNNPMAFEKLNEGIVSFSNDIIKLEELVKGML
jgi:transaldolase